MPLFSPHPDHLGVFNPVGSRVGPLAAGALAGSGALAANTIYAVPILLGAARTFTKLAFQVNSIVAGNGRVRFYGLDSRNLPGVALSADSGALDTGTAPGMKEATVAAFTLRPGRYWMEYVGDAAANLLSSGTGTVCVIGRHATSGNPLYAATRAFAYAALPDDESGQTWSISSSSTLCLNLTIDT